MPEAVECSNYFGIDLSDEEYEQYIPEGCYIIEDLDGERLVKKHIQEQDMHYKNGREAKNGDKVVMEGYDGCLIIGILYDAIAGNDHCNGRLAKIAPSDVSPNLKECLHLDDVKAAIASSKECKDRSI